MQRRCSALASSGKHSTDTDEYGSTYTAGMSTNSLRSRHLWVPCREAVARRERFAAPARQTMEASESG